MADWARKGKDKDKDQGYTQSTALLSCLATTTTTKYQIKEKLKKHLRTTHTISAVLVICITEKIVYSPQRGGGDREQKKPASDAQNKKQIETETETTSLPLDLPLGFHLW